MKNWGYVFILFLGALFLAAPTSRAQFVFAHMGADASVYDGVEDLCFTGDTELYDRFLCLSPSKPFQIGSVWFAERQDIAAGFGTIFQVQVSDPANYFAGSLDVDVGGDGFAFVIQDWGPDALGRDGGGLGYDGIPRSIAVEFDLWDNNLSGHPWVGDPNANHVSIHTCGTEPNSERESFSLGSSTNIPLLADGGIHTVIIEYEPGTLNVYIDDLMEPAVSAEIDLEEDLGLEDGKAWVGFTAATGMAFQNHDVLNWAFSGKAWDDLDIRYALREGLYPPPSPAELTFAWLMRPASGESH